MRHQVLVGTLVLIACSLPAQGAVLITAQEAQQTRAQDTRPAAPAATRAPG